MSDGSLIFGAMTFKNFLSWGNIPTVIRFDSPIMSVILGKNNDTGGEDSKNGVGKSAICDALIYVIFGQVIREVSNQKLINKFALKGHSMLVTLEFQKGDYTYRIERGEKPSVLKFFKKPINCDDPFDLKKDGKPVYDCTKSSKPETTKDIVDLMGFDLTLFSYLVANSSETDPFLKLNQEKKQELIEKLFGFKLLSDRAKELKEERKEVNKQVISEESRINATEQANQRIQRELETLKIRQKEWETKRQSTIQELKDMIEALSNLDVESEIAVLKMLQDLTEQIRDKRDEHRAASVNFRDAKHAYDTMMEEMEATGQQMDKLQVDLTSMDNSICPTCEQHWEVDPEKRKTLEEKIRECDSTIHGIASLEEQAQGEVAESKILMDQTQSELDELLTLKEEADAIELFYDNIEDATEANVTLRQLQEQLTKEEKDENPHTESISNLRENAMVEVSRDELKELKKLQAHYQLLIDLLVNKESYLRKAIIDRWLPRLNRFIAYYLEQLELPHRVRFLPDLSIRITNMDKEFDWGNLSKGQRHRVTLALNFAFQDVFEFMNHRINLLFVDELIDNGICPRGAESAVSILRKMTEEKQKRVLLVTHRDDIASRIEDQLHVVLKNNQSRLEDAA